MPRPPPPHAVQVSNVCRAFTVDPIRAEELLSSRHRAKTVAVLDAMAASEAVREFDRVATTNSGKGKGDKPVNPNFDADMAMWVQEVVMLGKRRAYLEGIANGNGSSP